jgi:cytochrome P450
MPVSDVPVMAVDLGDPQLLQDPFPLLRRIREAGPAVYNPAIDQWMLASYEHVHTVLVDDKRFAPRGAEFEMLFGAAVFEGMDNPRHNEVRGIYAPSFRRGAIATIAPELEKIVDRHLSQVIRHLDDGETVECVSALTKPVAALGLVHMLGVPDADTPQLMAWSSDMGAIIEAITEPDPERRTRLQSEGMQATAATCAYAGAQLATRRKDPSPTSLISVLANHPVATTLSEAEQRASVTQLVFAGHDNTTKTLSQILVALAQHPDQRAAVREDRSLVPQMIEEVLRWRGPVGGNGRLARVDVDIDGVKIPAGASLYPLMSAANHDPARWQTPERFDIFRERKGHMGLGFGTHVCLGLHLARLQAEIVVNQVLDRIPDYELAQQPIRYSGNFMMSGPAEVVIATP